MSFLYHLYVQIIYQTFRRTGIFTECRVDGGSQSWNIRTETIFFSYSMPSDRYIWEQKKKQQKKKPACDWAVEAALACWQANGGSLLSSSQHVCTSTGETLRLPLTISSSFFRFPPSLLRLPLSWYVTELIVKVKYTYIIRSGPFPLCVLIKPARALLLYWWTLMNDQARAGRQDIRNSTFTVLQVCSAFGWALNDPMLGSAHIWMSLSAENSAH